MGAQATDRDEARAPPAPIPPAAPSVWGPLSAACRLVAWPVRAAAESTGLEVPRVLPEAAARAVDRICAGPLPEEVGRALAEHRVVERIVAEALASGRLEHAIASMLESERTVRLLDDSLRTAAVERLLRGPEIARLVGDVLASPQARHALGLQSSSLAAEVGVAVRRRALRLDATAEDGLRRRLGRPTPRPPQERRVETRYAGIATRAVALATDAAVTTAGFVIGAALAGLVVGLVGQLRPTWLAGVLAGAAWLTVVVGYFAGFWSTVGQTPGMRLMRIRVLSSSGRPPGFGRSLARLFGLGAAIVPCFAGFLPVLFDGRRRGLPDFVAGTVVVYDTPAPAVDR